ncbi:MAG: homoserine O-acetyltransferase [Calditrichia bacterium]
MSISIDQLVKQWNPKITTVFSEKEPLKLESGELLTDVQVAYEIIGTPRQDGSNVILVCHALTGSAHVVEENPEMPGSQFSGWWNQFIGKKKGIDTDKYCVVCSNILGSCYGTTGPLSVNPATGKPYRMNFPVVTVRDMVRVQKKLMEFLDIPRVKAIIGGSLGAMQVWEWGVMYPDFADILIPIAAGIKHSAWATALNRTARKAIMNDPEWNSGNYFHQPLKGLALAREIAMISYKSPELFSGKFDRKIQDESRNKYTIDENDNYFQITNYLKYQGEKFTGRFDANSYIYLTKAMDLHDISDGRAPAGDVLSEIKAFVLWIGINTDMLYPTSEFEPWIQYIPKGTLKTLYTVHGHDGFLIEHNLLSNIVQPYLEKL